jgi:hypothetical protein
MGEWEAELFKRTKYQPLHYWRSVDDVWGLWTHGQEDLIQLVNLANNIHPRIQVELRYSQDSIEYVDVRTTLNNGRIKTDLYTKDTDKHQYLYISSNPPRKVKESIPYGLGIRLKRICSDEKDYESRKKDLTKHLRKRGYKTNNIGEQLEKVDKLDRQHLLNYNQPKNSDRIPLVLRERPFNLKGGVMVFFLKKIF